MSYVSVLRTGPAGACTQNMNAKFRVPSCTHNHEYQIPREIIFPIHGSQVGGYSPCGTRPLSKIMSSQHPSSLSYQED